MTKEKKKVSVSLAIPDGVTVDIAGDGIVVVKGPKGEVSRLMHIPSVTISQADGKVTIAGSKGSKVEKKMIGTTVAHMKNMFQGVVHGYRYRLKLCSGHFPMNAAVSGSTLQIKNFLGEKVPRKLPVPSTVKVEVQGADILVTSPDKEAAGQCALSIEQLTRRSNFDRRIFQDGAYITQRGYADE